MSCESSARQRIYKKHQALFPSKDKSKSKIKVLSAAIRHGSLRVKSSPLFIIKRIHFHKEANLNLKDLFS